MTVQDWDIYPNFTKAEFDCRETGETAMQMVFMERLQSLRTAYGKPMRVTSGYRSKLHSIEARKVTPGQHSKGVAVDIACHATEAHEIVKLALQMGFKGVGISQHKDKPRFVHLDLRDTDPVLYGY